MTDHAGFAHSPVSPLVLIVDDDRDSAEMYVLALSSMGFRLAMATNASDAFTLACDLHPHAIVIDIGLPGVSGLDLTRRLRDDPRTTDTSIIVLTGHGSDAARQRARDAGGDRFLVKPCLPEALALEICDVLARADASGAAGL